MLSICIWKNLNHIIKETEIDENIKEYKKNNCKL